MSREKVSEQRRDHLRHVAGRRELGIVALRIQHDRLGAQHILPEMSDLARGIGAAVTRRDVHDGSTKQIGARRFEPVTMRARERMTARESRPQTETLGVRDDRALDGPDVGDERARLQVREHRVELGEVGGGRRREDEEIGHARNIGRARWSVIQRALLRRARALGGFG